jgi:hypothetical protein
VKIDNATEGVEKFQKLQNNMKDEQNGKDSASMPLAHKGGGVACESTV